METPVFANRLRGLRESKGLSQEELARSLNMGRATIAMYETGKREPDFETLGRLAEFFSVTTDFLVGRSDDRVSSIKKIPAPDGDGANKAILDRYEMLARDMQNLPEDKKQELFFKLIKAAFPERFKDEPGKPTGPGKQ